MANDINHYPKLNVLYKKLDTLKNGFTEILDKTEDNVSVIESSYLEAVMEMKKLKEQFDRLMTETVNQAETIRNKDLTKMASVSTTCLGVIDQINKITSSLDMLPGKNELLFISMTKAECDIQAMKARLHKLQECHVIRQYRFEPDTSLQAMLNDHNVLGHLTFLDPTTGNSEARNVSLSEQNTKTAIHLKNIKVSDSSLDVHGTVMLSSKQLLMTNGQKKKLMIIDTQSGDIISETQLLGTPNALTKMSSNGIALTLNNPNTVQLFSVISNSLTHQRYLPVNGQCHGIAYNDKDETFIVTYLSPSKVEIINMLGTVTQTISKDSNGADLFTSPYCVAMRPDMSGVYVSDYGRWYTGGSVTVLNLNGDVEEVYKNNSLHSPAGLYVHKTGLVYVVDYLRDTVHQIDNESGKFKFLLNNNSGVVKPWSISYCENEDKMYVGMYLDKVLKVYSMKSKKPTKLKR